MIVRGKQFEEDLVVADLDVESVFRQRFTIPDIGSRVPVPLLHLT